MANSPQMLLEDIEIDAACDYRGLCQVWPWTPELIEAVHQERQIKTEKGRALPPFIFNRSTRVVLWSLRAYLVFMLVLIVMRLAGG